MNKKIVSQIIVFIIVFTMTFGTIVLAADYELIPFASLYKFSDPDNIEWIYICDGDYNYYTSIKSAISGWEAKTSKLNYSEGSFSSYDMRFASDSFGNTGWHGWCNPVFKLININDYYYDTFVYHRSELIAHEIGHANGLNDVSATQVLMRSSGYKNSKYPTSDDIEGINELY